MKECQVIVSDVVLILLFVSLKIFTLLGTELKTLGSQAHEGIFEEKGLALISLFFGLLTGF